MAFSIIIPYFNGEKYIHDLIKSIPSDIEIIVVDDHSDIPLKSLPYKNVKIIKGSRKGYFSGSINLGIQNTKNDVLMLNQDVVFSGTKWSTQLETELKNGFSIIGEKINGQREDGFTYAHGTFFYITREVINTIGLFNEKLYPLWGSNYEYSVRAARAGFKIRPLEKVNDFTHKRPKNVRYGSSISGILKTEPEKKSILVQTPPLISVVIPVHGEKYARFLRSTINSLVGGMTDLGEWKQQTFASFEVVIVQDSSLDNTKELVDAVCDSWKSVRAIHLKRPQEQVIENSRYIGKIVALNTGIESACGKYIAVLDADDMMKEDRLERMYNAIIENPHHIIYDNLQYFHDNKIIELEYPETYFGYDNTTGEYAYMQHQNAGEKTYFPKVMDYDFNILMYKNQIHNAIMFEKSAWKEVGGYPERFKLGRDDWAINVAFGLAGYCGYRIKDYHGFLYRRGSQNRTLENAKPEWMSYFLRLMKEEYPDLYKGIRPSSCCGNSSSNSVQVKSTNDTIRYTGNRTGSFSTWGISGKRYTFSAKNRVVKINPKDREDLLKRFESGKYIFQ